MKTLGKMFTKALVFSIVMMVLCSFVYPLALTGISQLTMKAKANGNLIDQDGNATTNIEDAYGSALVGQDFTENYYFKGRISSVNYNTYTAEQKENGEYGGVSSGSFNYGNSNPDLQARIQQELDDFLAEHPNVKAEDIPADLLTASGSGLDPHISPAAAEIQIEVIAQNSGLTQDEIKKIVEDNTEHKALGVFGEDKVNVLKCNLAIANAMTSAK